MSTEINTRNLPVSTRPPNFLGSLRELIRRRPARSLQGPSALRVGFVGNVSEPSGGAEVFLAGLISSLGDKVEAMALARWQWQIFNYEQEKTVLTYRDARVVERDEDKKLSTFYVYRPVGKLLPFGVMIWRALAGGIRTAGFFLRERVDIVHCHLLFPNIFFAYIAARLLRKPLVVTIHGLIDLDAMNRMKVRRLARYVLRRCDRVIVVSEEIRRRCLEWGIKQAQVRSCGIDTGFFAPAEVAESGILFIGNLTTAKGFDILADAYEDIRAATGEPLLLAGKNPQKLSFAEDSGIRYLGVLTPHELREEIRRCKLVVLPSRSEGTPLSVLEAMACNKLVLASQVGELPALITDRQNGFLLESLDAATLSARVIDLLAHHERYKKEIGDRPRETALQFDIERIAQWHHALYTHLISEADRAETAQRGRPWSLKRDLVLPLLVRLDNFAFFGALFRWSYRATAALAARVLRGPGVRFIYLRRGIAKREFMPFLSDIDMTVVVDDEASKSAVEAKLRRLAAYVPMLEAQNQAITTTEFRAWSEHRCFTKYRPIMLRLMEARHSWVPLYAEGSADPLADLRPLSKAETIAAVRSEAMFWQDIVAREYSRWILSRSLPPDAFALKRHAWIMMKATAELWNLGAALQEHESLLFSRREIVESARRQAGNARWAGFFDQSLALLDNRLGRRDLLPYIGEAHAHLTCLYTAFERAMRTLIDGDPELVPELRALCGDSGPTEAPPELAPVELADLPCLPDDLEPDIVAVLATPRPKGTNAPKAAIVIVIQSIESPPLTGIDVVRARFCEDLERQGVARGEIEVLLLDYGGFRCFGVPGGLTPLARVLLERREVGENSLVNQLAGAARFRSGRSKEAETRGGAT